MVFLEKSNSQVLDQFIRGEGNDKFLKARFCLSSLKFLAADQLLSSSFLPGTLNNHL